MNRFKPALYIFRDLLTATLIAVTSVDAAEPATILKSGDGWTLQNETLRADVRFSSGKLALTGYLNRESGTDYLMDGDHAPPLFTYIINGKTIAADDGGWTLLAATVSDITLYGQVWGKQLEILISRIRPIAFSVRQVFEVYRDRGGLHMSSFVKNNSDKNLTIHSSNVINLKFPDHPHTLYHIDGVLNWKSTTGGLDNGGRNAIARYDSGHGWLILPENNWATSLEPGASNAHSSDKLLGLFVWNGDKSVRVATNPKAVQLTLFPGEELEYFSVNLGVFKGDILDGRMAAAEHLRLRYKYHNPARILSTNMSDLCELIVAYGMIPGHWFSLQGKICIHGRGNGCDCADPSNVDYKLKQLKDTLIGMYHTGWDQVDAGLLWKTAGETLYSTPGSSVYRKILGMRRYMNTITHEYPDFIMQTTCEVDNPAGPGAGDSRGNQNIGLIHLADNGIAFRIREKMTGNPAFPADTSLEFGNASVDFRNGRLDVSTGRIGRTWTWTGKGLLTVSIWDRQSAMEYGRLTGKCLSDWDLPGAITDTSAARLVDFTVSLNDDNGFTNKHLEAATTVEYPNAKLMVRHVIWAFPDAPGIRTQLQIKAMEGFSPKGLPDGEGKRMDCGHWIAVPSARTEYLPLSFTVENARRYWGYYNNPGSRHDPGREMLGETIVTGYPVFITEDNNWASGLSVEYNNGNNGVCVVKESPKCVNQQAHYTGSFYSGPDGLGITGWGLTPEEIVMDRYRECWATWTIVWSQGSDGMQIDDGWQKSGGGPDARTFEPKYRNGWKDLKREAGSNGLRFGLWVTAKYSTAAELKKNIDELGFISWKVDFDRLINRSDYEDRIIKYRDVMKHAWMKTQFTLCPEYDDPRYGWYYCKEYGSIYFQNIQESLPAHLTMVPYQVLRQHWLMSKYFNSNKLQVMLQNPKRTNPERSDAPQHSHSYCFAMGVPFIPCFFQSAQYLDNQGREELTTFIARYKVHREAIFNCYTFPIGDKPDNQSWSGFQMINDKDPKSNYLLLFRELHNTQFSRAIQLKLIAGKTMRFTIIETGKSWTQTATADGSINFEINEPGSY